jgi:hypothetical protein
MAYKGKEGPCLERNQAVIYQGPFKKVEDDDGHTYHRGQRMAVCEKTYNILQREPYAGRFLPVDPIEEIPSEDAQVYNCNRTKLRHPRETKGMEYSKTEVTNENVCGPNCC